MSLFGNFQIPKESPVKLNVGGRIFLASSNTLKAEPASKLANIADVDGIKDGVGGVVFGSQVHSPFKDETGAFFIDSCPDLFGIILNWCSFKVLSAGPQVDLVLLERVANDLRLEEMVKAVREKIAAEGLLKSAEERQKERKQQEILEKLDAIILALNGLGTYPSGPKGPQPKSPFPYPHPDPDFI